MSNSIPTIVSVHGASASAPLAPAKPEEHHPSQPIGRDGTEGNNDVALLDKLENAAPRWNLRRHRQRTGEHPQPKISNNLTENEINEDPFLMKSALPPNHPQQGRPVGVQKMLNRLVPGGPLEGMVPETYLLAPKKN